MSINLINTCRSFEINSSIIEWDMKRAGLNLTKEFKLLPENTIKELEKLPKLDCDVALGKIQRKNSAFGKELEKKFTDVMNLFLESNHIDMSYDCTSIKKDACFVINKKVTETKFGENILFVNKNEYHAYLYLKPLEFYFKRNGDVDIKGLCSDKKTRNKIIELHQDGMINFLYYIISVAEKSNMDKKKLNIILHEFVELYKKKELDFDYYREFNIDSKYRYQFLDAETMADRIDSSMLEKVNIEYNYTKIILPLINLLI